VKPFTKAAAIPKFKVTPCTERLNKKAHIVTHGLRNGSSPRNSGRTNMISEIRELYDAELALVAGGGVKDANGKSVTDLINAITYVALVGLTQATPVVTRSRPGDY
jgi:hypothetical protein